MIKLKVNLPKKAQDKIKQFELVRLERTKFLQEKYPDSEASFNHAVMIDPIIIQINGYILKVREFAVPESIELVNEVDKVVKINEATI